MLHTPRGSLRLVVANMLDSDIVECEFEHHSHSSFHFHFRFLKKVLNQLWVK